MKMAGRIIYIIIEIIFTLITLLMGAMTAFGQYLYSEAKNSEMPLIKYDGVIYEKEVLMNKLAGDRNLMMGVFFFFLAITVALFIIGISRSKKRKMAAANGGM